jgi:hypothetical protein
MQNKILSVLFAATFMTCGLRAQETTNTAPAPAAPTSAPAPVLTQTAPAPEQIIYAPRLPAVNELTSVAAAQGLTIQQVSQSATQVTVIYKNSAGQLSTIAYQLLPNGSNGTPATVAVPSTPPPVVYAPAPRVVYYESYDPFYDPFWPRYYPPVSLSLGFGYYHGWGGHGGHHWR